MSPLTNPDGKHWGVNPAEAWQVEPKPVPSALTDTFEAKPFDPTLPFEHDHIDSWNSFGDLLGPEGVKRLMRAVQ